MKKIGLVGAADAATLKGEVTLAPAVGLVTVSGKLLEPVPHGRLAGSSALGAASVVEAGLAMGQLICSGGVAGYVGAGVGVGVGAGEGVEVTEFELEPHPMEIALATSIAKIFEIRKDFDLKLKIIDSFDNSLHATLGEERRRFRITSQLFLLTIRASSQ